MLRLAILGVGAAGTRLSEAVQELGRKLEVTRLVDHDAAHLAAKSAELGVPATYARVEDALNDPDIDAVAVCLPHDLHAPVAVEAARAGKHLLVSSPMARSVDEATAMIEAAEQNGVLLCVCAPELYQPLPKLLREVVRDRRFTGELTFASVTSGFRTEQYGYPGRRAWMTTPAEGGSGIWLLHGIHTVGLARQLFGEVAVVYLRERRASSLARSDVEGTVSGLLTMESDLNVSLTQTCETEMPFRLRGIRLYGERGHLEASGVGYRVYSTQADSDPPLLSYPTETLSAYAQAIEAFADAVSGIAECPATGRSERRSVAVVQAGYESFRTGKPIDLIERFGPL